MFSVHGYEDELWSDIPGYPNYMISNFGRVWNSQYSRFLKPSFEKDGYAHVYLYNDGKSVNADIHRLVASAFLPYQKDLTEVNHDDGDKYYNYVENLEWTTKSENRKHAFKIGLQYPAHRQAVRIIETGEEFDSLSKCARVINGHSGAIGQCLLGKRNKHKGFTFEYVE